MLRAELRRSVDQVAPCTQLQLRSLRRCRDVSGYFYLYCKTEILQYTSTRSVFEWFSPVHMKTQLQWKYDGVPCRACAVRHHCTGPDLCCHRIRKHPFLTTFVFGARKRRSQVDGRLKTEKHNTRFQKYPDTCGQRFRITAS